MAFVSVPSSEYMSTNAHNVQVRLDGMDIGYLNYRVKVTPTSTIPAGAIRFYLYINAPRPDINVVDYGYSDWDVVDVIHYYESTHTIDGVTKKYPPMITSDFDPFYHCKFTTCVVMTNGSSISSPTEQTFSLDLPAPSGLEFMLSYPVGEGVPYGYGNSESTTYEKVSSTTYKVFEYRHSYSYRNMGLNFKTLADNIGVVCEVLEGGSWKLWKGASGRSTGHPFQGEFVSQNRRKSSNSVYVVPTYEKCTTIYLRSKTGVVDTDITQNVANDTIETNSSTLKLSGSYMSAYAKRILLSFDTTQLTLTGREPEYAELFGFVDQYNAGATQLDRDYISVIPFMTNTPQWWTNTSLMTKTALDPYRESTFPLTEQEGLGSWAVSNKYMRFQSFKNLNSGLQKWLNEIRLGTRQERGLCLDFVNTTTINTDQPHFLAQENVGVTIGNDTAKGFFIVVAQGVRIPLITNKTLRSAFSVIQGTMSGGSVVTDLDLYDNPTAYPNPIFRVFFSKDDTLDHPVIISDYMTYNATDKFTPDEVNSVQFTSSLKNAEFEIKQRVVTAGGVLYADIEFKPYSLIYPVTDTHFASVQVSASDTLSNGDTTNYSFSGMTTAIFQGTNADTIVRPMNIVFHDPIPSNYVILDGTASIMISVTHADGTAFTSHNVLQLSDNPDGAWSLALDLVRPDNKELVFLATYTGGLQLGHHGFSVSAYESYMADNDTIIYQGDATSPYFNVLTIPDKAILFDFYGFDPIKEIVDGYEQVSFVAKRIDNTPFPSTTNVINISGGGSWRLIPESISLREGSTEIHGIVEFIGDAFVIGDYSFSITGNSDSQVAGGVQHYVGTDVSPTFKIKPVGTTDVVDPDTALSMEECLIVVNKATRPRRLVYLQNLIPEVYRATDVEALVTTFQESLNDLYKGRSKSERYRKDGKDFSHLFYHADDSPIGDAEAIATLSEYDYAIRKEIEATDRERYQSVLEMIESVGDLVDAGKIPFQMLRHLALDKGYDFGINIVGSGVTEYSKKYLRFLVDNLSAIFASKGTKDGLRAFMHAFGALVSVHYGWTTDYVKDWKYSNEADLKDSNGIILPPHEYIPFSLGDQRKFIPDGYFLTPHFKLDVNVTEVFDNGVDAVEELFRNIKKAIDWHKPVQCVCDELKLSVTTNKGIYLKGSAVTEWSGNQ